MKERFEMSVDEMQCSAICNVPPQKVALFIYNSQ